MVENMGEEEEEKGEREKERYTQTNKEGKNGRV